MLLKTDNGSVLLYMVRKCLGQMSMYTGVNAKHLCQFYSKAMPLGIGMLTAC